MSSQQIDELDGAARELIERATQARTHAHAPYSGFAVGAAARSSDGQIHAGCNIEISSYGLTMCAERVALFASRAAGATEVEALAVIGPGSAQLPTPPCGACRQVIWDLAPNATIYLATSAGSVDIRAAADLLPDPFGPAQLEAHRRPSDDNEPAPRDPGDEA